MVYLFGVILFTGLCRLSWIDHKTLTLPNFYTYPLIALGVAYAYLVTGELVTSVAGAAMGYSVFLVIEIIFKAVRHKEGLGRGDAKLLAVGGAWCGIFLLPYIVALSSLSALMVLLVLRKSRDEHFPFGPFLSLGIFIVWTFSSGIVGNDLFEVSKVFIT